MKEIKLSLSIDEANVLHKIATKERQKELEQLFPELKPKLITDRVKSYEDALRILNRKHFDETNLYTREIARRKLEIIIEAINEGWKPDFMNKKQDKWYCYLYINNVGFGYSTANYSPASAYTYIGIRLCFKNKELAEYIGKEFIDLYEQMLLT